MEFKELFESKTLPTVKQHVGMISIDTLERDWVLVKELPDNRMVIAFKDGKQTVILGRMAIRDDGKFCFAFEIKAQIDSQWGLCGMEQWHMYPSDYPARFAMLQTALKEAGLIS